MDDVWHLHNLDLFKKLSVEEIEKLRGASVPLRFDPVEIIFAPANHPHSLYLLESGLARIYRLSEDGAETTFGYVTPGEVFGELGTFGDYARESFAVAVRPCHVWKIQQRVFLDLLNSRPSIALEVTRQIGKRLKRVESRVEDLVFRSVPSRVARMLLELSEDFGETKGTRLVITADLTQSELATLIGTTRQTVNATLRRLEIDGLLTRENRHLVLLQPDRLRLLAQAPRGD